jgi:hypothetical protein
VNHEGSTGRAGGVTQFGRALTELNIDIICANSPQAKGRVERMNKTLHDRLVKELRLRGISTMEAGNVFLPHPAQALVTGAAFLETCSGPDVRTSRSNPVS